MPIVHACPLVASEDAPPESIVEASRRATTDDFPGLSDLCSTIAPFVSDEPVSLPTLIEIESVVKSRFPCVKAINPRGASDEFDEDSANDEGEGAPPTMDRFELCMAPGWDAHMAEGDENFRAVRQCLLDAAIKHTPRDADQCVPYWRILLHYPKATEQEPFSDAGPGDAYVIVELPWQTPPGCGKTVFMHASENVDSSTTVVPGVVVYDSQAVHYNQTQGDGSDPRVVLMLVFSSSGDPNDCESDEEGGG